MELGTHSSTTAATTTTATTTTPTPTASRVRRAATSGPGRAPGSDGRVRRGVRGSPPGRAGRRARVRGRPAVLAAGAVVRGRGDALFHGGAAGRSEPETVAPPAPAPTPAPELEPGPEEEPVRDASRGRRRAGWRERLGEALRERLPLWVQVRCGIEPRTLVALTVVLVVAAGLAGRHFLTGRPEEVRVPEVVRAVPPPGVGGPGDTGGPGVAAPSGAGGSASPSLRPAAVVVDVSGKVRRPGILSLPPGSRVADALRAAGGVRPGTDVTGLNRARVLMDGEQVVVGVPGVGGGPMGGVAAGPPGGAAPGAPVSLNSATAEQLDTLPGVGPVLAQHIVDYRTEHGGFRSVAELREVNGIGARRYAELEPLVRP
ncbi:helix-hairpin-helix domain-containing protein [Streptomyces sp. NPDC048604]|uniref:helix-hairpin-helix domain-containing protein n=1 Tax=Streptomyces sp. NPDC048604 TaxID=3365578 RepID=UPI0037137758